MNDITYFVMRSKGLGHEMYYCRKPGVSWTFKIAEALHWKTDESPKMIVTMQDSLEVSVVAMTRKEYFIRKLKGK